ncbi:carbohydrate kinase family protein [Paenibacillus antarcticus]|uniref:carbohydrate kinase family protein n=1 Tax=Paenibacillus antarcticus TaxID=253703 RepID=UPI001FE7EEEC|nr:carbohydrate kinase [Paenibacillus antarcticus]
MVEGLKNRCEHQQVLCIGELLIDFFCSDIGVNLAEGSHFNKQAGGAPANVAAAISRLGGVASFAGKVGSDPFGDFLIETLNEVSVNTDLIARDTSMLTTMAFVSLQSDGERDFMFNRGADGNFTANDLPLDKLREAAIVHFGSATAMLGGAYLDAYFEFMAKARAQKQFVSFDPNYRHSLWAYRTEEFINLAKKGVSLADFVKVSEEELQLISGYEDLNEGVMELHRLGTKVIAVTLGKNGTLISNGSDQATIPSISITSIDSTGAGDAFVGAVLVQLSQITNQGITNLTFIDWRKMIHYANQVGAIVCTKVGAIAALPTYDEVIRWNQ